jgi:hypothetical protein
LLSAGIPRLFAATNWRLCLFPNFDFFSYR